MHLLLDEHISRRIAAQSRARGYDVIALTDVEEMRGEADSAVFAWALETGRTIVTYDTGFIALLQERVAIQEPAPDLIVVPARRFPPGDRGHGALLAALAALLEADIAPAGGRLAWLDGP